MKIDRLIGIIKVLQKEGKVTAPYLAEKFGVSRRTVNRDIEDICRAGIPVLTSQGVGGGIYLAESYRTGAAFSEDELRAALSGIGAGTGESNVSAADTAAKKIGGAVTVNESIVIDLSSRYKDNLSEKTELIRQAIKENKRIKFTYYYSKGEEVKTAEPAMIVFKWSDWYVYGFSPARNDFRMYKLNRLWDLTVTDEIFIPKQLPDKIDFEENLTDEIIVTAVYDKSEKYRLVEEYGPGCFVVMGDGKLFSKLGFYSYESALRWFLSFGEKVKIVAPEDFRKKFIVETGKILVRYK